MSAGTEFAEEAVRAFNGHDVDWVIANSTSDLEWYPAIVGGVEGRVFRGDAGVHEMFKELDEVWEQFRLEPEEIRELGEYYLLFAQVHAKGKGGVEFDQSLDAILEVRDGKLASGRTYLNREDALAAAREITGQAVRE
jgi:ketosteroid isomerase-like protein